MTVSVSPKPLKTINFKTGLNKDFQPVVSAYAAANHGPNSRPSKIVA